MGVQTRNWEYSLLERAYEGFNSPAFERRLLAERDVLDAAYAYCGRLIRSNSRTFYLASAVLPWEKRQAVRALYAFCRATDDLIDQSPRADDVRALLANWQVRVGQSPNAYDPVLMAWADSKARYAIPHGYQTQLIEGIARDLHQQRYETFADLTEYCYGVASTVGLMVMHIIDFSTEEALQYAVRLGVALQLTNILRDVGVDWQEGRLYLPLDELAHFGVCEADIADGVVDEQWRAFMRFQIARARQLYAEAEPGIAMLAPEGRFAIGAAAHLYRAILDDIEAHDYDVFHRRAHVSAWGKMRRLPGVWWSTRGSGNAPQSSQREVGESNHAQREGV